jgi:hypothetical protein
MARKKKSKKKIDPLEGKVLVAKPGMEEQFKKAFEAMTTVAQGALGWEGQASMFIDLGVLPSLGIELKGSKKQQIKEVCNYLKQIYLQDIYKYSEWLTPEEAATRAQVNKVLYER